MADAAPSRRDLLRSEYLSQTARIPWQDLQTHYARGSVIVVAPELDLVEVAVTLGLDDTGAFQDWIASGAVAAVSETQAREWFAAQMCLWAVVAAPWVLVQARD